MIFHSLYAQFEKKFDEIKSTKYHACESGLSVWFIQLSTYFYNIVRFSTNYHFNTHTHTHTHTHIYIYIYIYIYRHHHRHHHHYHLAPCARIFLMLYRQTSQSPMASGIHPVSARSCCVSVRGGPPTFAQPCEGVHKSTSLMSSFQLLKQCTARLVRLILIVFGIGGKWLYSCCFVGCCLQDCSVLLAAFLRSCRQAFSPYV